ncbi:asparaginase [Paracoccaceae bacterium]|nr:asparaginase [Paracoccaceae bacterium]
MFNSAVELCEVYRGSLRESLHIGHAVVCDSSGGIVKSWGDPEQIFFSRSSSKMIQALPLLTSGAADSFGLSSKHLALACASHNAANIHTLIVENWLSELGLSDTDLCCGPQAPRDRQAKIDLFQANLKPCRIHNNCSGKHSGFLTLTKHLRAEAHYVSIDHPVQKACLDAYEMTTNEISFSYGIDGCSAPNHAFSLQGIANAMAWFADAKSRSDISSKSAVRIIEAMLKYPELVAGEGRACTDLMRAAEGKVVLKTGAEGFFVAIIPEKKMGVALKVLDGATRASESVIASILVGLGVLNSANPLVAKYLNPPIKNWDGLQTGYIKPLIK